MDNMYLCVLIIIGAGTLAVHAPMYVPMHICMILAIVQTNIYALMHTHRHASTQAHIHGHTGKHMHTYSQLHADTLYTPYTSAHNAYVCSHCSHIHALQLHWPTLYINIPGCMHHYSLNWGLLWWLVQYFLGKILMKRSIIDFDKWNLIN